MNAVRSGFRAARSCRTPERFMAVMIHLPPGRHKARLSAPGHSPEDGDEDGGEERQETDPDQELERSDDHADDGEEHPDGQQDTENGENCPPHGTESTR